MVFVGCQSISGASLPDTGGQHDRLSQILDSNAGKNLLCTSLRKKCSFTK